MEIEFEDIIHKIKFIYYYNLIVPSSQNARNKEFFSNEMLKRNLETHDGNFVFLCYKKWEKITNMLFGNSIEDPHFFQLKRIFSRRGKSFYAQKGSGLRFQRRYWDWEEFQQ